jgi:WD40 repeat protein
VRVWDIRRSGPTACLTSFDQHSDHSGHRQGLQQVTSELAKAHDGTVVTLAYAPDGNWLLSAGKRQ